MKTINESIKSSYSNAITAINCFPGNTTILALACEHHERIAMRNFINFDYNIRVACAKHENVALKMIDQEKDERVLLTCVKHEAIAELVANVTTNDRVLAQCAHHQSVRKKIEGNLTQSISVLAVLIEYNEELAAHYYKHSNPKIRQACAKHRKTAIHLINDKNSNVLKIVASHLEIALQYYAISTANSFVAECAKHLEIAKHLYRHESPIIRANCASHESIAINLVDDTAWIVRKACAEHDSLSALFVNDPHPLVRSMCSNTPDCLDKLITDESTIVLNKLSNNRETAPFLIQHSNEEIAIKAKSTVMYWNQVA